MQGGSGRLLILYGWLVGPLLAGYMLFNKAFAYIHLPGTPLYVGEMVLLVGALGCLTATGYLRIVVRKPPYRTSEDTVLPQVIEPLASYRNFHVTQESFWNILMQKSATLSSLSMRYAFLGSNGISSRGVQIVALP